MTRNPQRYPAPERWATKSLDIEELVDATDGEPWASLREAGFTKGDFLPLVTGQNTDKESTTSEEYVVAGQRHHQLFVSADDYTDTGEYVARAETQPDSDKAEYAVGIVDRFSNLESVISGTETISSGAKNQNGSFGDVDVSSDKTLQFIFRSRDGSEVSAFFGRVQFGVIL